MDFTCVSTGEWEPIYVVMSEGLRQSQICRGDHLLAQKHFSSTYKGTFSHLPLSLSESFLNYGRKHLLFVTVE